MIGLSLLVMAGLGAGAPAGPLALGDATSQLVYTSVTPCRIIDTRVAGGSRAPNVPRDFRVTGTGLQTQGGEMTGCGVPVGRATAAVVNFVAVNPVGAGNLRAWAYSNPPAAAPNSSVINYSPGFNIANAIVVPLCTTLPCPLDIRVRADASGTHMVADVVGYFEPFPKEQIRTFLTQGTALGIPEDVGAICVNIANAQVTVAAPGAGRILVQANLRVASTHVQGTQDSMLLVVSTTPTSCPGSRISRWRVAAPLPAAEYQDTVSVTGVFDVSTAGSYTYYINGIMEEGPGDLDLAIVPNIDAFFFPN
ncbi:MAG TPA: hypothetical protein VF310_08645 [Vicinamibacteria bacterium]